jgi:hypothetical protein
MTALLRALMIIRRPARFARSGFVLPTTALLVLMVLLTATALTYRAFVRSDQAMTQREQQVIVNAATPAIDRAKAKIEFMFRSDPRFPSGVPSSDVLSDLMAVERQASKDDDDKDWVGYTTQVAPLVDDDDADPYTLPDETRVDINNDGELDNAWSFFSDINGDGDVNTDEDPGPDEVIVYSIIVDDVGPEASTTVALQNPDDETKADALVTRTGPIATTEATAACAGAIAEGGWQVVQAGNNSTLQKNFQTNVFVANTNDANRTFESMEFQQSRIAARSSKWGAWFRYDLEIHPGPDFRWNGAMHTDGNLKLWRGNNGGYYGYLVSSPNSCVYSRRASEITLGQFDNDGVAGINIHADEDPENRDFQGQVMAAKTDGDQWTNGAREIHIFEGLGVAPDTGNDTALDTGEDSVIQKSSNPSDVAMNPLVLFAKDIATHVNPGTENSTVWERDPDWDRTDGTNLFNQQDDAKHRIFNEPTARPYVDDFFRADNRLGPKPRYEDSEDPENPFDMTVDNDDGNVRKSGVEISESGLNATVQADLTDANTGLDGYWERQAMSRGLRVIMSERLELGNPNGWGFNPRDGSTNPVNEALYPPTGDAFDNTGIDTGVHGGPHERLHRKSLQDNLAAVQSMVVYHYQGNGTADINDGEFPLACYAMTAHPGTQQTIINSRTFDTYPNTGSLKTDFLNGVGTNGWEFGYNASFDTPSEFATEVAATQPLGIALRNLAYFAGDPNGGAPSFPAVQGTKDTADDFPHPYPDLSMWGDFSVLRRVLDRYDNVLTGTAAERYEALSPADRATLHTAACTLGMLAYNLNQGAQELLFYLNTEPIGTTADISTVTTSLRRTLLQIANYLENPTEPTNDVTSDGGLLISELLGSTYLDKGTTWTDSNVDTTACSTDTNGFEKACDVADYFGEYTREDWETVLKEGTSASDADADRVLAIAGEFHTLGQDTGIRDRELGFKSGTFTNSLSPLTAPTNSVTWEDDPDEADFTYTGGITLELTEAYPLKVACNPNLFGSLVEQDTSATASDLAAFALVVCSQETAPSPGITTVKYPSLYYLFPVVNHAHGGAGYHDQTSLGEEYIDDSYIADSTNGVNRSGSVTYSVVGTGVDGVSEIAAVPRQLSTTPSEWILPHTTPAAGTLTNPDATNQAFRIAIGPNNSSTDTEVANVTFLDKGIFNGREMLNTRVLDIDLHALINNRPFTGADYWLSADNDNNAKGVVYAFREDAVREDEIIRPKTDASGYDADKCMEFNESTSGGYTFKFRLEHDADCYMSADPSAPQDPPLTEDLISLKPVDFVPDPMRRPYGFRPRTSQVGADGKFQTIDFSGGDPDAADARMVGMTFVTDNSVYLMGNMNPHTTAPNSIIDNTGNLSTANVVEEFSDNKVLGTNFANFYNRTTLNTGVFARLDVDHWRPVEFLSDAITVLSRTFEDGAIEDSFTGNTPSSYTNQTRPQRSNAVVSIEKWVHSTDGDNDTPVWVDRNGIFYYLDGTTPDEYYDYFDESTNDKEWRRIQDNKQLQNSVEDTYINATFVSGINPSRGNQGYGGLHNFPRFIQNWNTDLFIQGSFIQLNFSTASTFPFEQEAIEPGTRPQGAEWIEYYSPPERRWGYDVGLLYVPPAPAAARFVDIESPRSEYYREVPADDAYIVNLRCAKGDPDGDGTVDFIYSEAIRGTCPDNG